MECNRCVQRDGLLDNGAFDSDVMLSDVATTRKDGRKDGGGLWQGQHPLHCAFEPQRLRTNGGTVAPSSSKEGSAVYATLRDLLTVS